MEPPGLQLLAKIQHDQTARLIQLGILQSLSFSEEDFYRKIPLPFPLSDSARECGFNRLTLVLPRNLADYTTLFRLGDVTCFPQLEAFVDDSASPSEPYWIWWQYAPIPDALDPCMCRYGFPGAERGLTFQEGLHVALQHPEILTSRPLDCPGTRYVRAHHIPCIYMHAGHVEVSAICRPVYCRHVIMGGLVARILKD